MFLLIDDGGWYFGLIVVLLSWKIGVMRVIGLGFIVVVVVLLFLDMVVFLGRRLGLLFCFFGIWGSWRFWLVGIGSMWGLSFFCSLIFGFVKGFVLFLVFVF